MKTKKWYDYLWVVEITYFVLGFFNILFAWIGMIFFVTPLAISAIKGDKLYCNRYCGRGQLFAKLGSKFSRNRPMPPFFRTPYFRYGFLAFFMAMFFNMIFATYLVFAGVSSLSETLTLLWTFKVPWAFANTSGVTTWIAQYAFGFYSVMMTSTILGIVTMVLFKPRGFCVYCPMGTMTQGICKLKHKGES
ncbi:4Fe-4S binding protein [Chakrabartyella piscis]|uniref:4Fe-4S binding protein n=1 Tax=Chakrabartyella piscis TaxID=2918914 RepID=UPI002958A99D|nr:4Fe-4S binding protein [Chakrabartyella piscis]